MSVLCTLRLAMQKRCINSDFLLKDIIFMIQQPDRDLMNCSPTTDYIITPATSADTRCSGMDMRRMN